jgi:predicted RNA binding protein YcfA (HicA-like mRNA interferase family)
MHARRDRRSPIRIMAHATCLMTDFRRAIAEILKEKGWTRDRWNCRHEVLSHPEISKKVALPNKIDDRGLAHRVLRQAGIKDVRL